MKFLKVPWETSLVECIFNRVQLNFSFAFIRQISHKKKTGVTDVYNQDPGRGNLVWNMQSICDMILIRIKYALTFKRIGEALCQG